MFSDGILNFFKLRVSGDEGDGGTGDQGDGNQGDKGSKGENGGDGDSGNQGDQGDDGKFEISDLPAGAQKLIKDLRSESAKHRTNNNNLTTRLDKFESGLKNLFGEGGDDQTTEEKLDALQGNYESSVTRNAILELALDNGISGKENVEYFEFLMNKAMSNLKEGEELSAETLESIVSQSTPSKGNATTSTKKDGTQGKGPDENNDEVTQEEFNKMGMTQKSMLYRTKPELYKKLLAGANL